MAQRERERERGSNEFNLCGSNDVQLSECVAE